MDIATIETQWLNFKALNQFIQIFRSTSVYMDTIIYTETFFAFHGLYTV